MSDYFAEVERELRAAAARRAHMPWHRRLVRSIGSRRGSRVASIAVGFVFATTAITLAATGVILTGAPVRTATRPVPGVGDGIPVRGATRLLALRVPDPAGGLPWGMRVIDTTRGLVCLQIGRVQDGRLGQLGIDGAFDDDGRFHPLPADALPDVIGNFGDYSYENCAAPSATYAGDAVGLMASAASNPPPGVAPLQDRREISFGLLGPHARTITYRSGSAEHTEPVLPGLGAYLIVQPYTSGRRLGSVSETDGSDEPGDYSTPAGPNGALTKIVYEYAGRPCVDDGSSRFRPASCGLSEVPRPQPAPLGAVRVPVNVRLRIHGHLITGAELSFRAPYPVTSAEQAYYVRGLNPVRGGSCRAVGGPLTSSDVARGSIVRLAVVFDLAAAQGCIHSLRLGVEYIREASRLSDRALIGTATVREPPGTHVAIPRLLRHAPAGLYPGG